MAFILTKPLNEQKQEFIAEVNKLAGDKILIKYPIYKQINLGREPQSQETIDMYAYIDGIRNHSNEANNGIILATSIAEIRALVDQFKSYLEIL